ncbi:hypothetical protein MUCCIDRAFT_167672 [Mucor lusitanicus CBS 277.49]|uniref:Uncharacterized protein n=1 Tax=Mucor lusitanicus CBS 277.49 TaxID=747725 RepID=A0A162Q3J1_MUCCL|nr:hypothetical protein MUCCIDRAFT_167672 [Mucor lusitanicus CBS 277.49]
MFSHLTIHDKDSFDAAISCFKQNERQRQLYGHWEEKLKSDFSTASTLLQYGLSKADLLNLVLTLPLILFLIRRKQDGVTKRQRDEISNLQMNYLIPQQSCQDVD